MQDDLISRQAAIDAILGITPIRNTIPLDSAIFNIKKLPSAQKKGEWIPVTERLPKKMGTYMTTLDYGIHGLAAGQRYYYGCALGWEDEAVIAWMPLPEPYKEETTK